MPGNQGRQRIAAPTLIRADYRGTGERVSGGIPRVGLWVPLGSLHDQDEVTLTRIIFGVRATPCSVIRVTWNAKQVDR